MYALKTKYTYIMIKNQITRNMFLNNKLKVYSYNILFNYFLSFLVYVVMLLYAPPSTKFLNLVSTTCSAFIPFTFSLAFFSS